MVYLGLNLQAEGRVICRGGVGASTTSGAGVKSQGETLRWMDGGTGSAVAALPVGPGGAPLPPGGRLTAAEAEARRAFAAAFAAACSGGEPAVLPRT